jgi:hypothetical protein
MTERVAILESGRIECDEPVTATTFGELSNDFARKIRSS